MIKKILVGKTAREALTEGKTSEYVAEDKKMSVGGHAWKHAIDNPVTVSFEKDNVSGTVKSFPSLDMAIKWVTQNNITVENYYNTVSGEVIEVGSVAMLGKSNEAIDEDYYSYEELVALAKDNDLDWLETGGGVDYIGVVRAEDWSDALIIGDPDSMSDIPRGKPVTVYTFSDADWNTGDEEEFPSMEDAIKYLKSVRGY